MFHCSQHHEYKIEHISQLRSLHDRVKFTLRLLNCSIVITGAQMACVDDACLHF